MAGARSLFGDSIIGAVVDSGAVVVWGNNMWGTYAPQLPEDITAPTMVPGMAGVTAVSLGSMAGLCATDARGHTSCTGTRPPGRLGFMGWPVGFVGQTGGAMRFTLDRGCYVHQGRAACIGLSEALVAMRLPASGGEHTPVPLPGTGYVDVIPIGSFETAAAVVLKDDGTLGCQGTCTIGSGVYTYPLPSMTGVEEMDGGSSYLCLRAAGVIRCVGRRSGDGEGAPPVWTGDLTTISFPGLVAAP